MTTEERNEQRALAADRRAQELAPNDAPPPFTLAPAYVRATHPDTGVAVTFTPGESLPAWATMRLPHASVDELGVLTLPEAMPAASKPKAQR